MKKMTLNRRGFLFTSILALAVVFSASSGFGADKKPKKNNPKKSGVMYVPLIPKATEAGYSGAVPVNMYKLKVELIDEREVKDQIGQNTEDNEKPPIKVVADEGDSPAEFMKKLVTKQLKDMGATVVETPEGAERVVSLKMTKFWAEEAPGYHGLVTLAAEVKQGDKTVWRGAINGESKRFGRSLSQDNYRETISDAAVRAINKLCGEASFREAITKK